jgi:hypothetical protein
MGQTVTYETADGKNIVSTADGTESLQVARMAIAKGAPECLITDETGYRFRLRDGNEISGA